MSLPVDANQKTKRPGDARPKRDAMIFVPGLNHEPRKTIAEVSRKIAAAVKEQLNIGADELLLKEKASEEDQGNPSAVVTIARKGSREEPTEIPLIDIYEMSYRRMLTGDLEDEPPIKQFWSIFPPLGTNLICAIKALRRGTSGSFKRRHIILTSVWNILVVAYISILLLTVVMTLLDALSHLVALELPWLDYLVSFFQDIVVVSAVIGLFTSWSLKRELSRLLILSVSSASYLNKGDLRSCFTKEVSRLVAQIGEKNSYGRIHLIAYSFGSIIALNYVFPTTKDECDQRSQGIDTLVTIGCPYSYVRTFWDDYFDQRVAPAKLPEWLNIYITADPLATDFDKEERGIDLQNIGPRFPDENKLYKENPSPPGRWLWDKAKARFAVMTFAVHRGYWGKESDNTECFKLIVKSMYKDGQLSC